MTMGDHADFKTEEAAAGIQFVPPLYTQRYVLALKILQKHNIQSVVDFGCSECGFLQLLPTASCVRKVALVDVDRSLLVAKRRRVYPEVHHFLQRRPNPLHVALFHGSAEEMDARIHGFEAATLIEVIEHLHPSTLSRVTENVFGCLHPRLCFVTTPNFEFNVLFHNEDPAQLRHWDHKFEWTRDEFRAWCEATCSRFGYEVKYTGVGQVTSDPVSARLGPCSQAAVFTVRTPATTDIARPLQEDLDAGASRCQLGEPYELIAEADFPYVKDEFSAEEKLDMEVSFCLREIVRCEENDVPFGEQLSVSVSRLADCRSVEAMADIEAVRKSLERQLFTLTSDRNHVLVSVQDSSSEGEQEYEEQGQATHCGDGDCAESSSCGSGWRREKNLQDTEDGITETRCKFAQLYNEEEEENWDDPS